MTNLKEILITQYNFIDNDYLNKYLKLLTTIDGNDSYCELHHIIPVSYYKYKFKCKTRSQAESFADHDDNNFSRKLSYNDHVLAHWYLYNCTTGPVKHSNEVTCNCMLKSKLNTLSEEDVLNKLKQLKENSKWYWTSSDIIWLVENYNKKSKKEIVEYLNRSYKAIQNKANYLGITKSELWTAEEVNWLKANRTNHSLAEIAQYLKRTVPAVKAYCLAHNIVAIPDWTENDINWLKENYTSKSITQCAHYLNRSQAAIRCMAHKLNLHKYKIK